MIWYSSSLSLSHPASSSIDQNAVFKGNRNRYQIRYLKWPWIENSMSWFMNSELSCSFFQSLNYYIEFLQLEWNCELMKTLLMTGLQVMMKMCYSFLHWELTETRPQINFASQNSNSFRRPCSHHSKMQKDDWAIYDPKFSFKWCKQNRRTLGNKNKNAVWMSFWEIPLFDQNWYKF